MRLPDTFRVTVTSFGVKIFDPIEKRMMWLSKPTFSTLFMGAKSVEIPVIPRDCIRAKVIDTGRGRRYAFAMAYKESRQKVIWRNYDSHDSPTTDTKYSTTEIPIPNSLWIVLTTDGRNDQVQIYALKEFPVDPSKEFTVYHFPFPNSSAGMTCYGQNDFRKEKIEGLLPMFFSAPFTKELIHSFIKKDGKNNFEDTWDLFRKLGKYETFPYSCLESAGTFNSNWRRLTKGENDD